MSLYHTHIAANGSYMKRWAFKSASLSVYYYLYLKAPTLIQSLIAQ